MIKKSPNHVLEEAYDFLYEIVIGYSEYNEEVLYKGDMTPLKEANFRAVHEHIDLYFDDLESEKDEITAQRILDVISLFLDEKSEYIDRLAQIEKSSVIDKEIEIYVFEYRNRDKVDIMDRILKAKKNRKESEEVYQKVLTEGLAYLSEQTRCIKELTTHR